MHIGTIATLVMFAILSNDILYSFLQWLMMIFCCQGKDISPVPKQFMTDTSVNLEALWYGHA